jgi:hypothetical protein
MAHTPPRYEKVRVAPHMPDKQEYYCHKQIDQRICPENYRFESHVWFYRSSIIPALPWGQPGYRRCPSI